MTKQVQTGTLSELVNALTSGVTSTRLIAGLASRDYDYSAYKGFADVLTGRDTHNGSYDGSQNTRYLGALSAAADCPIIKNLLTHPLLDKISPGRAIKMMVDERKEEQGHAFRMFIQYCQESNIDVNQLQ